MVVSEGGGFVIMSVEIDLFRRFHKQKPVNSAVPGRTPPKLLPGQPIRAMANWPA
tara:strand:- start:3110 stop:3274 length:165 start_codon:yes stop_codon:yes gene_type:complete